MTKKIFTAIAAVALALTVIATGIIVAVMYGQSTAEQLSGLQDQTAMVAHGLDTQGTAYLTGLATDGCRITLIKADGTVTYDNQADPATMGSHADRQEVVQALAEGQGHSIRYSQTLTRRELYYAQRLADGSVVRLARQQPTVVAYLLMLRWPLMLILTTAVVAALWLSSVLSKDIAKPFGSLDLDHPLDNDTYPELAPLLVRLEKQHVQIQDQQQLLARQQDEFYAITDRMGEGLVLLGPEGTVLSINRAACDLFSTDRSCIGSDAVVLDRQPDFTALLARAASGPVVMTQNRQGRDYRFEATPVVRDGKPGGIVLAIFDVTDRLQAEQMRRQFTANVSHELKTPLHSISGYAELLADGMVAPGDVADFGGRIHQEAQRLIDLVNDIIRLSRLDEGDLPMDLEQVELHELARQTVQRLDKAAQDAGVTLTVAGSPVAVEGYPALLADVLYNLADNAIKYNRRGGRVDIETARTADRAVIKVTDTGIGIPDGQQQRVFERFYRVDDSRSAKTGGTGLGLSIVKHAVQLHHGTVTLASRLGQGTAVTVTLPLAGPSAK